MDLEHKDTFVDVHGQAMYQGRLHFENGKVLSPTDVFDKVKDMVKKNGKDVRSTVGRMGDLLLGSQYPGASFFFTMGWYLHKAISVMETDKKMGDCSIEFDSEVLNKEQFRQYFGNYIKREAKKMETFGDEILKTGLPDDMWEDESEE